MALVPLPEGQAQVFSSPATPGDCPGTVPEVPTVGHPCLTDEQGVMLLIPKSAPVKVTRLP